EVFLPGAGWIGLDPTSGLLAGEGHLPLACTPEPSSAAPISGAVDQCETKFVHEMKVTRIHESPRVTKPYTEEQWQEIVDLGNSIGGEPAMGDVRIRRSVLSFVERASPANQCRSTQGKLKGRRGAGTSRQGFRARTRQYRRLRTAAPTLQHFGQLGERSLVPAL